MMCNESVGEEMRRERGRLKMTWSKTIVKL